MPSEMQDLFHTTKYGLNPPTKHSRAKFLLWNNVVITVLHFYHEALISQCSDLH